MKLYPAMDLYNQQVVRLEQGDFKRLTVYHDDPLSIAKGLVEDGAAGLHIVDLQAAQTGTLYHQDLILKMAQQLPVPLQVGGGLRSYETAARYLDGGVAKVVLGTLVFQQPDVLKRLVHTYPGRVVVALDVLDETVRVHGWQDASNHTVWQALKDLEDVGVTEVLITDIATDGMLQGPNVTLYQKLQAFTALHVIASGGISGCHDIQQLAQAELYAAVLGKALYEKKLTVKEALACSHVASSPV
jgi:phosphoribosylformimino-5-aminoimidazole carboxamide ribotide isomerase